jgi:hypothetical protein
VKSDGDTFQREREMSSTVVVKLHTEWYFKYFGVLFFVFVKKWEAFSTTSSINYEEH